jgi:Protein of unknown function (DUF2795)
LLAQKVSTLNINSVRTAVAEGSLDNCKKSMQYILCLMSDGERENPEQIPSEENIEQTKAMVSEQGGVSGERKEVDVKDYPKAAAIGQILKDLDFPADKKKIIEYAERARPQSEEILTDLQQIAERQYNNVSDVTKAAGLVRQ